MKITIPSGCENGIKMVKKAAGNKQKDFEPGDVIIVILHKNHDIFIPTIYFVIVGGCHILSFFHLS